MKQYFKRQLTLSDASLIVVNLIPIWGVWFKQWDAVMVFLVYCMETVIVGIYNFLQLWLTTLYKKQDVWQNNDITSMQSGYLFMFLFLFHYGFFVFIQLTIFLSIIHINGFEGNAFTFILHFARYMPSYAIWLLVLFSISYGLSVVKDYVINGLYKTMDMGTLLFAPYGRIFIQQIVVIIGSFFLLFQSGSKFFIVVFAVCKIVFGLLLDFKKIITEAKKKQLTK
jgi:hypothetical protein